MINNDGKLMTLNGTLRARCKRVKVRRKEKKKDSEKINVGKFLDNKRINGANSSPSIQKHCCAGRTLASQTISHWIMF